MANYSQLHGLLSRSLSVHRTPNMMVFPLFQSSASSSPFPDQSHPRCFNYTEVSISGSDLSKFPYVYFKLPLKPSTWVQHKYLKLIYWNLNSESFHPTLKSTLPLAFLTTVHDTSSNATGHIKNVWINLPFFLSSVFYTYLKFLMFPSQ